MDPRIGLDWLHSDVGQLRPVQFRSASIRVRGQIQKYDYFAVQSYELRPVGSGGTFAYKTHWVRVASWSYAQIISARNRIDTMCSYLKGHRAQHRTVVRMFGRDPHTGKWDVISTCDVPRR